MAFRINRPPDGGFERIPFDPIAKKILQSGEIRCKPKRERHPKKRFSSIGTASKLERVV